MIPRPRWALDPDLTMWPMASTSFYLRPQPKPTKATIPGLILPKSLRSRQSQLAHTLFCRLGLARRTTSRARRNALEDFISCMLDSASGSIVVEHIYWSGNHFQSHSHHTPLPHKRQHTINDIGPFIALTMEVIIVSPLTLSYKYEKLKKKEGEERERIELSRGRGNFVESLGQKQPKVRNSSP